MEKINSPYEELLGMYVVERKEGFCKIGLSYRKELTNPHGKFHGGLIASIIDTAAVQALRTLEPKGPFLTANLEIRYLSSSSQGQIFAQGISSHLKGKFFVTQVKVLDKNNELIAEARVKSFLPSWQADKPKKIVS
ncbi:MAG: PaaI family thioesterase [Candidatus Omnitrophica bacterium]|nr:PaaI family thioesterase [Candidatus Omnitrophota bacterium]